VVLVALVGGFWPAVVAAIVGSLLLNYYFVEPLHTFTINEHNNLLALLVFVAVAVLVSLVVDTAARRTRQAARAAAESELLSTIAGSVLRGEASVTSLLERVREAFAMDSATLLERSDDVGGSAQWHVVAWAGGNPCARPDEGDTEVSTGDRLTLVLCGRPLPAQDRRVLGAFAAQAAVALEQTRLTEAAAAAVPLEAANRLRTALLAAVGHDLRTPLAEAKAAVTGLRGQGVAYSPGEQAELLAIADSALDRLARLVDDLLDLSRLQAGALEVTLGPMGLDDVVALALDELGPPGRTVTVDVPVELPDVVADPALVQRIITNLLSNALRYAPGEPPRLTASALGDEVQLRVVDTGPGVPVEDRDRVFAPFQRLGDADTSTGVGLGLALARGLAESMGGSILPEDTPGGGLTMVLTLPAAHASAPVPAPADDAFAPLSKHP
jgi:two-component system sensor histidine kinase KdpD